MPNCCTFYTYSYKSLSYAIFMIMKFKLCYAYNYKSFKFQKKTMLCLHDGFKRVTHVTLMIHGIFIFMYYCYSISVQLTFLKAILKKPTRGAIEGSDNADSNFEALGPYVVLHGLDPIFCGEVMQFQDGYVMYEEKEHRHSSVWNPHFIIFSYYDIFTIINHYAQVFNRFNICRTLIARLSAGHMSFDPHKLGCRV